MKLILVIYIACVWGCCVLYNFIKKVVGFLVKIEFVLFLLDLDESFIFMLEQNVTHGFTCSFGFFKSKRVYI